MDTAETTVDEDPEQARFVDTAIMELLQHRCGEQLVYTTSGSDRRSYRRAFQLGLVTRDGCLTPAALRLVATDT